MWSRMSFLCIRCNKQWFPCYVSLYLYLCIWVFNKIFIIQVLQRCLQIPLSCFAIFVFVYLCICVFVYLCIYVFCAFCWLYISGHLRPAGHYIPTLSSSCHREESRLLGGKEGIQERVAKKKHLICSRGCNVGCRRTKIKEEVFLKEFSF